MQHDTFFARLHLAQENELGRNYVEIDARPSDAMVLAVRSKCPIYVTRSVWEQAADMRSALEQAKNNVEEKDEDQNGFGEEDRKEGNDNP